MLLPADPSQLRQGRERSYVPAIMEPDLEQPAMDADDDQATLVPDYSRVPESSEGNFTDDGAPPLPPEYACLRDQMTFEVDYCCRYSNRKHAELVKGPGDNLHLGPALPGKSHTLVLDVGNTILLSGLSLNGSPINDWVRPKREPDARGFFPLAGGGQATGGAMVPTWVNGVPRGCF